MPETLAAKGQNLFLTGRSADKLNALKEELSSKYPSLRLIVFACDLTDERSRAEMYKTIDAQGVVFDRLCNVAGADIQKAFEKYTEKKIVFQWPRQSRSDPFGDAVRFVAPRGRVGDRHDLQYVGRLSQCRISRCTAPRNRRSSVFFHLLRSELKGSGVKITTVLPGGVYTRPISSRISRGQGLWGKMSAKTPEYIAQKSLQSRCAAIENNCSRILE